MPLQLPPVLLALQQRWQRSLPAAFIDRFISADLITQAASLAFFALLSLAPLLVLLLWLTSLLYPAAQESLLDQLGQLAGQGAATVADTVIENANTQPSVGSLAGLWSTILLFVGASAVFARLQTVLNLIFQTDEPRLDGIMAWLRKRVFSFGIVLALGFLLLISMLLSTVLQVVFAQIPSLLPVVANVMSLVVYVLAFAFLYHYLPDRPVQWPQAFMGGVLTAGLFVLGRYAIGLYISHAAPGSAYGTMGTLVILLVWIYYATLVFFVGAALTAVIDERYRPAPAAAVDSSPTQA
ncbi:YihY/virulence factor BrkB family protein [Pseudoxanthomonas dokdonensis]|uniref:BrkB protein n=1 Tax=Pseudoxanthomonas dokdonensis TaxID=344882 RepID=A0A0R0CF49_9GAMM|nr:BrkB protein [Pseudoxanthomonas dokdonensis]